MNRILEKFCFLLFFKKSNFGLNKEKFTRAGFNLLTTSRVFPCVFVTVEIKMEFKEILNGYFYGEFI